MAVSVTSIGVTGNTSGATTISLTVSGGVPAGALIYVAGGDRLNSTTARTITDSASNTYSTAVQAYLNNSNSRGSTQLSYVANCAAIANNGTITYTQPSSGTSAIGAAYATGMKASSVLDIASSATGSGTTASGTSPTPTVAGNLVVAFAFWRSGNLTLTADSTWTNTPGSFSPANGTAVSIIGQYYVESGLGTKAYSATSSSSFDWSLLFASFKAATNDGDFFFMFS